METLKAIKASTSLFIPTLLFGFSLFPNPSFAGTLAFSKPVRLATLPWSTGTNHGVSTKGPEWLLVDPKGRWILETGNDFDVYSPKGRYVQSFSPISKSNNFYGFSSMEALPDGKILLLARLESPLEQLNKDNFEERTKPGVRLLELDSEGKVLMDKELVDPHQPHSSCFLESGIIYSVHEDGTFEILDSVASGSSNDPAFGNFASVATSVQKWMDHLKDLPVFHSGDKIYHDVRGNSHVIKGAVAFLVDRPFVEGVGPLAERDGKIYYQVICDKNQEFINAVFLEDTKKKDYGLVELIRTDEDLDAAHGHALFVDKKGNLFEGVAKKDGYRIYEWKHNP